jgi:ceramide glucosyltransferase
MFSKAVLALWSCAGLVWWVLALYLVSEDHRKKALAPESTARRTLSVFKPLPPLGLARLRTFTAGIESFVAQLDPESELLIGIHEADRDQTACFLDRLRTNYPKAQMKVVYRSEPDNVANPKIAWQKILAAYATGELWLWSDADVVAPSGFLRSARLEFARSGTAMMTFPYIVREISSPPKLLEALFVNVEFYPGVLLLRKCGLVDFGLGAAMLFRRDDFLRKVEWDEIGAWLADDFFLGQKLHPVRIGATTLTSVAASLTWKAALSHDFRWAKTIRWNRPAGSFARILVMPMLGWMVAVVAYPTHFFAWLGFLGMVQADVLFAMAICRHAGGQLSPCRVFEMEIWSFWRIILWFLSWAPRPIRWNGRIWRGPKWNLNQPKHSMTEAVDK